MKLRIFEDARSFEADLSEPVEMGRQQVREGGPYTAVTEGGRPVRVVIAWNPEVEAFSRRHLRLEPLPGERVRVANLSARFKLLVHLSGGDCTVGPEKAADLTPPFTIHMPGRTLLVGDPEADSQGLLRLSEQTLGPGRRARPAPGLHAPPSLGAPQFDQMVAWLQTTMGVLQGAVGSADFLPRAAETLVEIVGLHSGRVLLRRDDDGWEVAVARGEAAGDGDGWRPSDTVLNALLREKHTVWQRQRHSAGAGPATPSASLQGVQTVVAAPLLDAGNGVIGALYGERRLDGAGGGREAGKLEAVLVEMLACGVAAGLARQAKEKAALEAHIRLEQFFGPDLAGRLVREPGLLEGREAVVTLLFCDVRGFSRFSGTLGPAGTMRWMNDVLSELSGCVIGEGGVLVNYVGDELLAMWGAPRDQADQARRAVQAALAMLAALPALNERWQEALGGPTEVGVGVSTGPAQVGNTGSRFKFQYGPLGNTVNLGSRVQGLTKYLKCPLLVTRATRERLGDGFASRRVVKARVVNIEEPVDLYEVEAAGPGRRQFFAESEAALEALETGDFALAAHRASVLLLDHRGDGPLLLVLSRASTTLVQDGRGFDPVWEPPGK